MPNKMDNTVSYQIVRQELEEINNDKDKIINLAPEEAKKYFKEWLYIRILWQKGFDFSKYNLGSLMADIDHSALLDRLLNKKLALDEPPPLEHSYPVYPD